MDILQWRDNDVTVELWPADVALISSSSTPRTPTPPGYICHFGVLALLQTTTLKQKQEYALNLLAKKKKKKYTDEQIQTCVFTRSVGGNVTH